MKTMFAAILLVVSSQAFATGTWCAHPKYTNDGFVNLRTGPGTSHSVVSSVISSDMLFIDTGRCREAFGNSFCDESGKWVFVEAVLDSGNSDENKSGWINSSYIVQTGCSDGLPWCDSERLNPTEATICNNEELKMLDTKLAQVYGQARATDKDYDQRDWLKSRRDTCGTNVRCIAQEYKSRIAVLSERIGSSQVFNSRPWCMASRLNITERTICNSSYLRDLDASLQIAYGQARARQEDSGQHDWLRHERNACGSNETCIAETYRERISVLRGRLDKYRLASEIGFGNQPASIASSPRSKCSENHLLQLKAVCVISAVGEQGCSSALYDQLPSGAISSTGASTVCAVAAGHLADGSIDPTALGLSVASGYLNGAGDSLLASDKYGDVFVGVILKLGSLAMTATSIGRCFDNANQLCQ